MHTSTDTRATTILSPGSTDDVARATVDLRSAPRVASVDLLRGIVVLLMIFVNDVASVRGAPAWMKHISPSTADGMTFVDVVFPAFLFMVGVAIPLSVGRRLDAGEPAWSVWRGILGRVATLLAIGVLMVNSGTISREGPLPAPLWSLLMYVGVLLTWSTTSARTNDDGHRRWTMIARMTGIALLVGLVLAYRGNNATGIIQLRPQWWGILGLIGWAYLVGCIAYIATRRARDTGALIGIVALLYLTYLADAAGLFQSLAPITRWLKIGGMLGSHGAITVSGVVLGTEWGRTRDGPGTDPGRTPNPRTDTDRLRWAVLFGAGLFAAGMLLHSAHDIHRAFIFNKNAATPAWSLVSSAYTVWLWCAIYWLVDVRGWSRWGAVVRPAGEHPLLAYLLPSLFYYALWTIVLMTGVPDLYAGLGSSAGAGILRALALAFGVVWFTGWLIRRGLRFRV